MEKYDLVLGTETLSGNPKEFWCIGFFLGMEEGKYLISGGVIPMAKAKKISSNRRKFLLNLETIIQDSPKSLWWWARQPIKSFWFWVGQSMKGIKNV